MLSTLCWSIQSYFHNFRYQPDSPTRDLATRPRKKPRWRYTDSSTPRRNSRKSRKRLQSNDQGCLCGGRCRHRFASWVPAIAHTCTRLRAGKLPPHPLITSLLFVIDIFVYIEVPACDDRSLLRWWRRARKHSMMFNDDRCYRCQHGHYCWAILGYYITEACRDQVNRVTKDNGRELYQYCHHLLHDEEVKNALLSPMNEHCHQHCHCCLQRSYSMQASRDGVNPVLWSSTSLPLVMPCHTCRALNLVQYKSRSSAVVIIW